MTLKQQLCFSESDINFTIDLFAYYGDGKANTKRVIEELCEYLGVEDKASNHKLIANKIRTFNPNRKDCTEQYRDRYIMKRKQNLTNRHEPDGIYSRHKQRIYYRAVDVLFEKMTPTHALKVIEAENRFAIENKNLNIQERIERQCLADDTGDSSFRHGDTQLDLRKPQ